MSSTPSNTPLFLNPPEIFDPTPFGFCQSVACPTDGQFVFISGQGGNEDLEHSLSPDFRRQVQFGLKNLVTVLAAHGLQPEDTLKVTVLIVDHSMEKLGIWSEEMLRIWNKGKLPASTLIPVPRLAVDGMLFEIDGVAYKK